MANLNKVLLMGNLTRDPELRYAPSGAAVTTFSIAMSRSFNSPTGEKKEEVSYVRIVCWAKLAQICSEYLFKGRPVFIEGRLQSRSWQAPDGAKRNTMEVIAQNVQFLGKGKAQGSEQSQSTPEYSSGAVTSEEPVDNFPLESRKDEEVPF